MRARELNYEPEKVALITNVCAVLHNICISHGLGEDIDGNAAPEVNEEGQAEDVENPEPEGNAAMQERARAIRLSICDALH